jgi:NAD(P)-dependent dehydrogenase (short-subunit alcohol dehydrogenase family)
MPTILITGANRGLGLEFARQYRRDGWRVIGTVRDLSRATELFDTGAEVHRLDAADEAEIRSLGQQLQGTPIDVLLANAGIYEGPTFSLEATTTELFIETFRINTIGPVLLARELRECVRASEQRKMIAITSKFGSISFNQRVGHYAYRASKAALNAAWHALSLEFTDLTTVLVSPGWVRTSMGGPQAPLSPEQSATNVRRTIAELRHEDTGCWFDSDGVRVAW